MRIGLVADTHLPRFGRALPEPLLQGLQGVDLILHMGDFTAPWVADLFEAIAPFDAVAGNNDPVELCERFGRQKVLTVEGVRLGLVHGDGTRKTTRERAIEAFQDTPVDVVLYGHSHMAHCERRGSVWVINPGSPTDKRRSPHFSYGLLSLAGGTIVPELRFF